MAAGRVRKEKRGEEAYALRIAMMLKLVRVLKPWPRAYVGSNPKAPKRTNSKPIKSTPITTL